MTKYYTPTEKKRKTLIINFKTITYYIKQKSQISMEQNKNNIFSFNSAEMFFCQNTKISYNQYFHDLIQYLLISF